MRISPVRETISIDALLVRAYREKKIDRLPSGPRQLLGFRGPMGPGLSIFARGDRVDTPSWGASEIARARETMAKLIDAGDVLLAAHDLVLKLDDYFFEDHRTTDCRFTLWTRAGALEAGHYIEEADRGDTSTIQAATVTRESTPDGDRVTVAPIAGTQVRRLYKIVTAPLIVLTGRSGEPPYISAVEIERMRNLYGSNKRHPIGQEPVYVVPLDVVVRERAEYAAWHHALAAIMEVLADLPGQVVTAPACSARPWESASASAAA